MKASILIPNYNHGPLLLRNLDSVLRQDYANLELVIVDDGSKDESVDIIREYEKKDKRIKAIYCVENLGFPKCFKLCCDLGSGDIVFGLASDDYILEHDFISRCVEKFRKHPEIGIVWAKTAMFYDDGEYFTTLGSSLGEKLLAIEFLEGFLRNENFVAGYSAVFRKKCLDLVGGFQFDLGPQTDYFPNHAVPSMFGGCFIDQVMTHATYFRDGSNYCSKASTQEKVERHAEFEKRMRHLTKSNASDELWSSWRKKLIKDIAANAEEYAHEQFLLKVGK